MRVLKWFLVVLLVLVAAVAATAWWEMRRFERAMVSAQPLHIAKPDDSPAKSREVAERMSASDGALSFDAATLTFLLARALAHPDTQEALRELRAEGQVSNSGALGGAVDVHQLELHKLRAEVRLDGDTLRVLATAPYAVGGTWLNMRAAVGGAWSREKNALRADQLELGELDVLDHAIYGSIARDAFAAMVREGLADAKGLESMRVEKDRLHLKLSPEGRAELAKAVKAWIK